MNWLLKLQIHMSGFRTDNERMKQVRTELQMCIDVKIKMLHNHNKLTLHNIIHVQTQVQTTLG